MKRFFFSLIALAAAAVSCTQSALLETPTLDGTPVSFSPYTGRTPVTKATSIATATELGAEGGFNVYCFLNGDQTKPLLADEPVTMTDGVWGYTNTIFWPASGSLDFVAYSANAVGHLVDKDGNHTDTDGNPIKASSTGFTFEVPESIDEQVDLLATAYQAGKAVTSEGVSNGNVTLKFFHLLSRVGFKIQTTSAKDITIKSLSLIGTMPNKGTLTFATAKEEGDIPALVVDETSKAEIEYNYSSNNALISGGALDAKPVPGMEYMMIMPHTTSGHTIKVIYQLGSGAEQTAIAELEDGFQFVPGKAYEFVLQLSTASRLTFEVTEEDWNPELPYQPSDILNYDPYSDHNSMVNNNTSEKYGFTVDLLKYDKNNKQLTFNITFTKYTYIDPKSSSEKQYAGLRFMFTSNGTNWTNADIFVNGVKCGSGTPSISQTSNSHTIIMQDNDFPTNNESLYFYCAPYYGVYNPSQLRTEFVQNSNEYTKYNLLINTTQSFDLTFNEFPANTPEAPFVTIENISINNTAPNTADVTLAGSFYENESRIVEYGFCWDKGDNSSNLSISNSSSYTCTSNSVFAYTIEGLTSGLYRCCAYVKTEDAKVYYSTTRNIEIEQSVDEEDNTDSSWGDGGNADFN